MNGQGLFMNDIATLVSVLNSTHVNGKVIALTNEKIEERINLYFTPVVVKQGIHELGDSMKFIDEMRRKMQEGQSITT